MNKMVIQVAMLTALLTVVIITYALVIPFFKEWLAIVIGIVHALLVIATFAAHVRTTLVNTTDPLVITKNTSGHLYCNICKVCRPKVSQSVDKRTLSI
jgi:hypothetical protein